MRAYGDDIGRVVKLKTVELGRSYEDISTTLGFFNNMIVTEVSGTFINDGTVTGGSSSTGTIVSFDSDRGLLRLKNVTLTFTIDETLTSDTSGTSKLKKLDVTTKNVLVLFLLAIQTVCLLLKEVNYQKQQ